MKVLRIERAAAVITACLAPMILVSCATGAKSDSMIASDIPLVRKHDETVRLSSGGGRSTEWWGSSQIGNEDFMDALHESLRRSGVFRSVVRTGGADLILDVFIEDVRQPILGL